MTNPLKRGLRASGPAIAVAIAGVGAIAADYPTTVQSHSPLVYYRFSETTPAPAALVAVNKGSIGAAGNGYGVIALTDTNTLSGHPGIVGNSYLIENPANTVGQALSKVDVPWNAALNPQGSFTVEFWAKPNELTTDLFSPISSLDGDGGKRFGWLFYQTASAGWMFRLGAGLAGGYAGLVQANNTVTAGQWHHVVGVYDDSAKTMALYVNGQLVAGPTATSASFAANGYNPLGNNGTGRALRFGGTGLTGEGTITGNRGFDGGLDEVAVYSIALTADRVAAHFNTAKTNSSAYQATVLADAPVGYWPLDEAAYTAPDPTTYPVASNAGSLGSAANGVYEPGIVTGAQGPQGAGFGPSNTAIWGNGAVGGVSLTNLDLSGNITIVAWVQPYLTDNLRDIVAHGFLSSTDSSGEIFMRIDGDQYEVGSWDGTANYETSIPIPDGDRNNWVFLAATYDGSNWNLYRYDQLASSSAQTTGALSFDASWGIGLRGDADPLDGRRFGGGIDEVAVFNTALSASDLQALFYSAQGVPILTTAPSLPAGPVFEGSSVTLNVAAVGQPPISFQWTKDGSPIGGQTGSSLALNNLKASDSALYAVVATNPNGSVTNGVQINVLQSPPVISVPPVPQTRFAGATIDLTVTAGGGAPLGYQWVKDGSPIGGQTATNLVLANVQSGNQGAYSVIVKNSAGSVTSAPVAVTIVADPAGYASTVIGDGPIAYYRLDETSGTVAHDYWGGVNGTYFSATLGVPGFSVIDPDTAASFAGANSYVGKIDGAAINLTGSNVTYSIEAWVNGAAPQPVDGAGIVAKGPGSNGGNGDEQFAIVVSGGNYQYYVRESSGATPVSVTAAGGPDGTWQHIVATYDGPNQVMTLYVNGVAQGTATPPANGPFNTVAPISIGARRGGVDPNYDLYFTGSIDEVAIYPTVLQPAQVTAHYNAQYGAHFAPVVEVQPQPETTYVGLPVTLTAAAVGTVPISYQWYKGSSLISGATSPTYTIASAAVGDTGNYYAAVSNPVGSTNTATVAVTVLPAPTAPVALPDLVLHLPFDGNTSDTSGRHNNGTPVGGPTYVADGKLGQALHYDSDATVTTNVIASYVTLGTPADLLFSSNVDFTVAFWIRLPVNYAGGDLPFIGNVQGSTFGKGWVLDPSYGPATANWPGGWAYSIYDTTGAGIGVYGDQGTINDGSWHHLAYVFDRQNGETTYLDGVAAHGNRQSGTTAANLGVVDTGLPIVIGQDPTGKYAPAAEDDSADIDDLGIWRRALTAQQVGAIFTAAANKQSFTLQNVVATPITISPAAGGKLTVTIGPGGTLQSAPSITGPFTPVAGAAPPSYTVTPGSGQLYFRAVY
jgi:Concanavalin A-like lectin/glucanases superfamily/Immunoglobulin domain/Immunoglobulin I-set domain